jgi:hypothetical protein
MHFYLLINFNINFLIYLIFRYVLELISFILYLSLNVTILCLKRTYFEFLKKNNCTVTEQLENNKTIVYVKPTNNCSCSYLDPIEFDTQYYVPRKNLIFFQSTQFDLFIFFFEGKNYF